MYLYVHIYGLEKLLCLYITNAHIYLCLKICFNTISFSVLLALGDLDGVKGIISNVEKNTDISNRIDLMIKEKTEKVVRYKGILEKYRGVRGMKSAGTGDERSVKCSNEDDININCEDRLQGVFGGGGGVEGVGEGVGVGDGAHLMGPEPKRYGCIYTSVSGHYNFIYLSICNYKLTYTFM